MSRSSHPRGNSNPGLSYLLLGGKRTTDVTVGYPVHRAESWKTWTNPHGAQFTDWTASCGATGSVSGPGPELPWSALHRGGYHSCLPGELCPNCWIVT